MKKNSIKNFALCLFALFAAATTTMAKTEVMPVSMQPIVVSAGTSVIFQTAVAINAKTQSVGNSIRLTVFQDVKVGTKVVIKAGATTMGKIVEVVKNCDGTACERLVIEVTSVSAIGGSATILLNSNQHTIEAPCCNGSAVIQAGTIIEATVRQDTTIEG